jgi:hypothetical protein
MLMSSHELLGNIMAARRYVVKMVTSSPAWTGTVWAFGCKHLASAQALFHRRSGDVEAGDCSALLLIDRDEGKVLQSVGTNDPEQTVSYFGF